MSMLAGYCLFDAAGRGDPRLRVQAVCPGPCYQWIST
jgi:hypothetical protein